MITVRYHPFSRYAKFSEENLTPFALVRVSRGKKWVFFGFFFGRFFVLRMMPYLKNFG